MLTTLGVYRAPQDNSLVADWATHILNKVHLLTNCYSMWQEVISDPEILNTVKGLNIEFIRNPWQGRAPDQKTFSLEESKTTCC